MYSKYIDNSINEDESFLSMDDILSNIFNFEEWRTAEIDPFTQRPLKYEISKVYDEDQKIEIKGTEFNFNYIKYSYDTVISGQETNPISVERLKNTNGAIVIYTDSIRTQYLVDRARGASALRILRVINNSDKNKIIEAQSFNITEDFFIWLISRFMDGHRIIDEENSLSISRIIGFRGEGSQKQAILSGSGNEVMNLLSSLSFLIEMDVMTEIEVRIISGSETYEIRFYSRKSQLDVLVDNYVGEYMMVPSEERNPRVLLKAFIDLIPSIMNAYNEEIDNGNWTKNSKREFTLGLVDSVKEKLNILYPSQNTES
ncbi:hypothetical protein [Alkalihalobacterium chitinilyticum]|uniref:Uncharacterized protein n=1 Tax=Alkalihalobacterium chitinilyticum TaxID=2980103 RepID=A0ABT5VGL0_9BACI|nr:hypothetical protein [Alkalihalobacterium chitinilyticum]MDE5414576.1 hypothetical protein [Alkalihalobacterium chitinilyticum]